MKKKYDHKTIEKNWQAIWEKERVWDVSEEKGAPKFYILDMFPYPSAEGLHVGHPEGYTASDIVARYLRLNGHNVLHPMGFDSFGLPAENYAIKTGTHPATTTQKNIDSMRKQIKSLGFSYDWSREVITSDPAYYRWTQWIFLQLFKHGLAYEADAPINWCPSCKTGLANEEVVNGKCERCGTEVSKKQIKQWLVKITDERYIERLQNDLDRDELDWPESIKLLQKNWIGRSEGADVDFEIADQEKNPPKADPSLEEKKFVVLVHGSPSESGYPDPTVRHWFPWMSDELKGLGFDVVVPEMPQANAPVYKEWKQAFENAVQGYELNENTVLVGHSAGTSFLVRYLSEQKKKVGQLVLVAPSKVVIKADSEHYKRLKELYDFKAQKDIAEKILIMYSTDDKESVSVTTKFYKDFYGAEVQKYSDRGHFTENDGAKDLPEALDWIRENINIRVFTTRPDTLFGATYMVLAPEHPLVKRITATEKKKEVSAYVKKAQSKSDLERTDLAKDKTGVFTGAYAINPVNNEKIQIWVADYVLISYGTGAIMAVPAHDERDNAFAKKYKLPIIEVIKPSRVIPKMHPPMGSAAAWGMQDTDLEYTCWTGDGEMINSGEYNEMDSVEFKKKITTWLEKKGKGKAAVNYKLRDWLFSRQRYWGEPIPIVHCEKCGHVAVPEKDLPLKLPDIKKYKPTGTGESPLAGITDWVNTKCPKCGGKAQRETNTMPQWAGSNWYWMRYCDPHNDKQIADPKKLAHWLPVDIYVGGAEHAVLHLLYARFIYKFLCDIEVLPKKFVKKHGDEPFKKLKNQGIILGEDGVKMSKSRGNVINPDDVVEKYGADTLRMYEMFMGPFEDKKPWSTDGIKGVYRFLNNFFEYVVNEILSEGSAIRELSKEDLNKWMQYKTKSDKEVSVLLHKIIKKVTNDIEEFKFNTAISQLMIFKNKFVKFIEFPSSPNDEEIHQYTEFKIICKKDLETFLILLFPFAPHLSEELWEQLGHKKSISYEKWPVYKEELIRAEKVTIVVQVNGKKRDEITMPIDADKEDVILEASASLKVNKYLPKEKANVKVKSVFVPNKIINFVV